MEYERSAKATGRIRVTRKIDYEDLLRQGLRFLGAGFITFPVGIGVSALAHEVIGLSEKAATAIALGVLLVLGFVLARQYVFNSNGHVGQQAWRFLLFAATARFTEYLLFLAFFELGGINYLFSLVIALGISFVFKFVVYRGWIFSDGNR